jgi:hypothetical protein
MFNVTLTSDDIALFSRPLEEFNLSIESTTNCDGGPCNAPGAPHDPTEPHWHLRMTLPDIKGERLSYIGGL